MSAHDQHVHPVPARTNPAAEQASPRAHDLALRLSDTDGDQPDIRRLAPNDVAGASHLRSRHDRRADRDLRTDAVPATVARQPPQSSLKISSSGGGPPSGTRSISNSAIASCQRALTG